MMVHRTEAHLLKTHDTCDKKLELLSVGISYDQTVLVLVWSMTVFLTHQKTLYVTMLCSSHLPCSNQIKMCGI